MAQFFYRGKYSPETIKTIASDPKTLAELMRPSAASFGGRVVQCLAGFGGEPIGFMEFPDNASASAWFNSLVTNGTMLSGTIEALLSDDEWLAMLKKVATGLGGGGW